MESPVTRRTPILALALLALGLAASACSSPPIYTGTIPQPSSQPGAATSTAASPTSAPRTSTPTASATTRPTPTATPTATATPTGTTIKTASNALGTILVDGKGRTVYLFEKDTGATSNCYGACAGIWPPVLTKGAPVAGSGAQSSLLGTTKRTNGTLQVTYAGHPLYYYAGDSKPGQTSGEGLDEFGAKWYVLGPNGAAVT